MLSLLKKEDTVYNVCGSFSFNVCVEYLDAVIC